MEIKNEAPYNRLVLVGNGFDLALGLKTSYANFLLDHIKSGCNKAVENGIYQNGLMNFINNNSVHLSVEELNNFNDINKLLKYIDKKINLTYKNFFTESIVKNSLNKRWVDIEQSYYDYLLRFFKGYVGTTSS